MPVPVSSGDIIPVKGPSSSLHFLKVAGRQTCESLDIHSLRPDRIFQENASQLADAVEHAKLFLGKPAG